MAIFRQRLIVRNAFPTTFRRRLSLTIVITVAVAAAVLAIGIFVFARAQRLETFHEHSARQLAIVTAFAGSSVSADQLDAFVQSVRADTGYDAIIVNTKTYVTRSTLTPDVLPPAFRNGARGGNESTHIRVNGIDYLVLKSTTGTGAATTTIYLLFSQSDIDDSMAQLLRLLLAGSILVVVLSALVADVIAKKTLAPVRRSSEVAQRIAAGEFDLRIPVTGNDEFGYWAASFNSMTDSLASRMRELDEARARERLFTLNVAHDLRNPLAAMVSANAVLSRQTMDIPESAQVPLDAMRESVLRLRHLVVDLLEVGELENNRQSVRSERVFLPEFVDDTRALLGIQPHMIRVHAPAVTVVCDRRRTQRVLQNLLDNAMKYATDSVTVSIELRDGGIAILVEDDGPGIPPEKVGSIFDRFSQLENSDAKTGLGLGLAIVANHVRAMNGSIAVDNAPSGGARFSIFIPSIEVVA